ncbi:serine O-acetyltransferase [Enterococcus sp. AZ194]|uniref:serine acetyltransferase n=1 Tax=Enterococcus sp. AZ194 TaxID=2774629 RepID=UPI003F29C08B
MNFFDGDYRRFFGGKNKSFLNIIKVHSIWYLYLSRLQDRVRNRYIKRIIKTLARRYGLRYGLELCTKNIGPGLYLGHAFNITVHEEAVLGKNVNLNKGCTIGIVERGHLKGCPTIGDEVYVGTNSTVIGKIVIGNDVQIAPNTLVNMDVPSHSVVIGSPAVIKPQRLDATKGYIKNKYVEN